MSERTFALIKPDCVGQPWLDNLEGKNDEDEVVPVQEQRAADKSDEILKRIEGAGFAIVQKRLLLITKAQAQQFYAEHRGKPFFDTLCDYVSSSLSYALVLEKDNAIAAWRELMGPTNSAVAKAEAEAAHPLNEDLWSLRALFGTDGTQNAVHGSDSAYSATREMEFFFPTAPVYERTLALVKPDAQADVDIIIKNAESQGLLVVARTDEKLSPARAKEFYGEHAGKPFFDTLVSFMSSGNTTALVLEGPNAISKWRLMIGPTNSEKARDCAPQSIRGLCGTDGTKNAVHGSDSQGAVAREVAFWFKDPLPVERTLALVKPGAADASSAAIKLAIANNGFDVLAERRLTMSREQAEAFYEEHRGKAFFNALTSYMSSGPVLALVLSKVAAIKCWRSLMGPTNTATAKVQAPDSLRARFGTDGTRNATHGSDSPASSAREIRFFFPHFRAPAALVGKEARNFITKKEVATTFTPLGAVPKTLHDVLVEGLTELCKEKPAGLGAVEWLGQWLLANNPRHGRVTEADSVAPIVVEADDDGAAAAAGAGAEAEVLETKMADGPTTAVVAEAPPQVVVYVVGRPGSSKAATCQKLSKMFGYAHISTGELLRAEVKAGTALGKECAGIMSRGDPVNQDVVLKLVKKAMSKAGGNRFLIEGAPRSLDQLFAFEAAVGAPAFVLHFDVSESEASKRIMARASASGRADDNAGAASARLDAFSKQAAAALDFYGKLGCVRAVNDADGVGEDAVFAEAARHFDPEVVFVAGPPGAGKTTVSARVAEALGYTHLESQAMLEAEAAKGGSFGRSIAKSLRDKALITNEVMLEVVRRAIDSRPGERFLLDGYPRTRDQARAFTSAVGEPRFVLSLECSDAAGAARLGASSGDEGVARRQRVFAKGTAPLIDDYAKCGMVRAVDASVAVDRVVSDAVAAASPTIVFVLGGPGSGKGTQCANIVAKYGYTHLSAGDLLRAEVARGSADGAMIDRMIRAGQIVPVEVTLELLRKAMRASGGDRFLIDGFPRAMDQAHAFESVVGKPNFVLFFDVDEATMKQRLLKRGQTSGRADDNEASIVRRFATFRNVSMPVVNAYARQGKVRTVDARASPDEVFAAVQSIFDPTVVFVLGGPGSGKGTQCANIVKEFGFAHLSAGDLLRAEVARGSRNAPMIEGHMAGGSLVPVEVTLALLKAAMRATGKDKFLIDGYPRAMDQAEAFEASVAPCTFTLFFDVDEATMRARLLKRGKTSGRIDDNEAAIVKRFVTFQESTPPVLEHYEGRGLLRKVSSAASVDAVYDAVRPHFQAEVALLAGASGSGRGEFATLAGLHLGYHRLHAQELLRAEVAAGTPAGAAIGRAMETNTTPPTDAVLSVLQGAVRASNARRFLIDGFPRLVSGGFPGAHDQAFALEAGLGRVKGLVALDAGLEARRARVGGAPSVGEEAALIRSVDTYNREKQPVIAFYSGIGKAVVIDTSDKDPAAVFDEARAILA